jgi:hypothetical protein
VDTVAPKRAVAIRLLFVNPYVAAFDNDMAPLQLNEAPILRKRAIRENLQAVTA